MRLIPLKVLLALLLLAAPLAAGCSGDDDDNSSTPGDDDSSSHGDDDATTGDDDATTGDDDATTGDDDATTGDDDATTGDDDDSSSTPKPGDDADGDGYKTPADCDDNDADVHPDATETCNNRDDNCDGSIDEGVQNSYYLDADEDGYGDLDEPVSSCSAPEGYVDDMSDCDDTDEAVNPGALEVCDTVDNDCDARIDEEVELTFYQDADHDGDGDPAASRQGCEAPEGYVETGTDCDDADATVYAGAAEACDDKDNNCDSQVDEGVKKTWYTDADKDGYGDDETGVEACVAPEGTVDRGGDCDEGSAAVNPGATETCNKVDDNCDGNVDENAGDVYYPDADGDKYGDASAPGTRSCEPGSSDVADNSDCNDKDKSVFPGAPEDGGLSNNFPDGKDNDCDGAVDEDTVDETIYDIQQGLYPTGTGVAVQGAVAITGMTEPFLGYTNVQSVGFFLNEPEGGEYAGILVQIPTRAAGTLDIEEGDLVTVTGIYQVAAGGGTIVVSDPNTISVTGSGTVLEPVTEDVACDAAGDAAYAAMRVTVEDISADTDKATGFNYNSCLNVSTALFFPPAEAPDFITGQTFYSVTGVLFARGKYDLEITSPDEIEAALFSYVDPAGGTYSAPVTVTFKTNDASATIYYTTDGTAPTTASASKKPGETLTLGLAPVTLQFFAATATETEPSVHTEAYRFQRTANPHLLLSELVVSPTDAEYIEIYNPTDATISLDGYYLSDAASNTSTNPPTSPYEYAKIVLGDPSKIRIDASDFIVAFPAGAAILPYEFLVIGLKDGFKAAYGFDPDFEFSTDTDTVSNMVAVAPTKFTTSNPTLSNSSEMVMLFYWDGKTDLVTDVDYVVWGSEGAPAEAVDKTGQAFDGPDADTQTTAYKPDTARAKQQVAATSQHVSGGSFCRTDFTESSEQNVGGNGTNGQDETSEPLSETWTSCKKNSPGM